MPDRSPLTASLSPLPVRVTAMAVLVLIALAAIWLIDRRAVQRMHELEAEHPAPARHTSDPRERHAPSP